MEIDALQYELHRRKIVLELDGTQLVALDPHGRLSPRLDMALRQHKKILIAELQAAQTSVSGIEQAIDAALIQADLEGLPERIDGAFQQGHITQSEAEALAQRLVNAGRLLPAGIEDLPLSIFAQTGQVRTVQSKVLGETVLWAADNAVVSDDTERVVYRAHELTALVGISAEALKAIHAVKKVMDGVIEAPEQKTNNEGEAL